MNKRNKNIEIGAAIFGIILILAINFAINIGVIALILWLLSSLFPSIVFSWKMIFVIALILAVLSSIFKPSRK